MRDKITGYTQLLTLMAYPIRHSQSPAMHNEALSYLGLDYVYLCFDVDRENLPQAMDAMRTLRIRGGNVSMPNKIAVIPLLDRLTDQARLCGAVNTIINDDGVLTGHITDGIGFTRMLADRGFELRGKKMTIIGAGGAAKAIQVQTALEGLSAMTIFNMHDGYWERARGTMALLNGELGCPTKLFGLEDLETLKNEIWDSDLVVNATEVGMTPQKPWTYIPDPSYFRPGMPVVDIIYAPPRTRFLELAQEAGCQTMNGLSMMLFQGAEAFRLWTGQEMPIGHMKEFLGI